MRATTRILIRDGYDALTTNRVAETAGVSVGTLYQYFPNKEALVAALLEQHVEQTFSRVREAAPALFALPVPLAMRRFVELMLEAHSLEPELHRVFAEQLPKLGAFQRIEDILDEGTALARAYPATQAEQIAPKDLDLAAFVVVRTVEALTHGALRKPGLITHPALADEITACVVRYLTSPG